MPRLLTHVSLRKLGRVLGKVLHLRRTRVVGVRFVSSLVIQRLNRRYRQINRPTDILSFKLQATSYKLQADLGDVVICPAQAQKNARRQKISLQEELVRLLAHGVLHLAGFDHRTKLEEKKMFHLQEFCVKSLQP